MSWLWSADHHPGLSDLQSLIIALAAAVLPQESRIFTAGPSQFLVQNLLRAAFFSATVEFGSSRTLPAEIHSGSRVANKRRIISSSVHAWTGGIGATLFARDRILCKSLPDARAWWKVECGKERAIPVLTIARHSSATTKAIFILSISFHLAPGVGITVEKSLLWNDLCNLKLSQDCCEACERQALLYPNLTIIYYYNCIGRIY